MQTFKSAILNLCRAKPAALFAILIGVHIALWVMLPALVEHSLRLDTAEGQIGGPFWLLAYPKHPPLWLWLVAACKLTGPLRYFSVYTVSQLLAIASFLIVARFAFKELNAKAQLLIVLGLVTPFATYVPIQLNPNIVLMPIWALTLWSGFLAFERRSPLAWIVFGACVGFGIWAKYAILHLVCPLIVLFFCCRFYRQQTKTIWPWLAGLIAIAIAAPHAISVVHGGGKSLKYALHTVPTTITEKVGLSGNFLMNTVLVNLLMGLVCWNCTDGMRLLGVLKQIPRPNRTELFLHCVTFGPVVLILASPLFDIRPRPLWITPFAVSFVVWWAYYGSKAGVRPTRRLLATYLIGTLLFASSYLAVRLIGPHITGRGSYAEMNGPALARLAENVWHSYRPGPIPYLIGIPHQAGRHAIGSIAFDLPYVVPAMDDGNPSTAPWIDLRDLDARGALVVAAGRINPDQIILDRRVVPAGTFLRPMIRGQSRSVYVSFGIIFAKNHIEAPTPSK